jgi:hypothetical protein
MRVGLIRHAAVSSSLSGLFRHPLQPPPPPPPPPTCGPVSTTSRWAAPSRNFFSRPRFCPASIRFYLIFLGYAGRCPTSSRNMAQLGAQRNFQNYGLSTTLTLTPKLVYGVLPSMTRAGCSITAFGSGLVSIFDRIPTSISSTRFPGFRRTAHSAARRTGLGGRSRPFRGGLHRTPHCVAVDQLPRRSKGVAKSFFSEGRRHEVRRASSTAGYF